MRPIDLDIGLQVNKVTSLIVGEEVRKIGHVLVLLPPLGKHRSAASENRVVLGCGFIQMMREMDTCK